MSAVTSTLLKMPVCARCAALLISIFVACGPATADEFTATDPFPYTPKNMVAIPAQRTTHCIGRYLIDLPSNFELRTGGWGDIELYYGLDKNFQRVYATVKQQRYSNAAFWEDVNKRRFELQTKKNDDTKGSMLLHGEQINKTTALLRRLPDEESAGSIKSEVHVLVGERYVTLEQESYSYDENDITYLKADPAPAEARLKMIASKLLPYQNAERAKPGFCMQGVLFDVGQDDETAPFRFQANEMGDVRITVEYHAVTGQPSKGLLERFADAAPLYPGIMAAFTQVKKGKAQLGDAPAEEYLAQTRVGHRQHVFQIERRTSEPRTLNRPFFGLELSTGNQYQVPIDEASGRSAPQSREVFYSESRKAMLHRASDSSLSDDQVMKLWNEIVASVRKR